MGGVSIGGAASKSNAYSTHRGAVSRGDTCRGFYRGSRAAASKASWGALTLSSCVLSPVILSAAKDLAQLRRREVGVPRVETRGIVSLPSLRGAQRRSNLTGKHDLAAYTIRRSSDDSPVPSLRGR